ncbi:histidine phosphatase family protein [Butyrivibrio sp. NC3005]|uniref:histidine phosphatase family protein n=1 Tax=Butyrivibrio sp. NC3005 TaxID=1280685 RepID=UPI000423E436|nr:histidine phosphatase family protein [Butyrivibrio sp. NC3005]
MKIWLTRHGQTNLNKNHLMQGRTDEPLNEKGILQAQKARCALGNITFDAVYSSPLQRAIHTASIIGNTPPDKILIDERLIETDFGKYEKRNYMQMGLSMSFYWACPEFFNAPKTVETLESMIERSYSFVQDLEKQKYKNVLITCHGGIMRVLSGCLADNPRKYIWRPKPHNCEIRVFSFENGIHSYIKKISI